MTEGRDQMPAGQPAAAGWQRMQAVRIAESIAADLRHRILRGDFADGVVLPKQDDLVAEFGVSYPSIREALRILETENLITVRRGKVGGAEVRRPGAASAGYALGLSLSAERVHIGDLAQSLLVLEPVCVSMCAESADRRNRAVPVLKANVAQSKLEISDETGFTSRCREFHELLAEFAGNQTIRVIIRGLESLWSAQEETWAEALSTSGSYFDLADRESVLRAHRAIASDIERGDAAGAARHAKMHIAASQKMFLERFTDQVIDVTSIRARSALRSVGPAGRQRV